MKYLLPAVLIFISIALGHAQDPTRFSETIDKYNKELPDLEGEDPIVFVGSSSIGMWKDVGDRFKEYPVINRGFGGSQMSDLLYYLNDLVIKYKPKQVFIYEGDNDLASKKTTETIMKDTREVVNSIHKALPSTQIVLIAAKPSVARWELAPQYIALNKAYAKYADQETYLSYADVWNPAMGSDGKVRDDIFLDDNLHMNSKGYDIWEEVLRPMLIR